MTTEGRSPYRWLRIGLGAVVTLAFVFFLVRQIVRHLDRLRTYDLSPDVTLLAASAVVLSAYLLGRAALWHGLTVRLGAGIPVREAVAVWFASQTAKYVPGKIFGYASRTWLYTRRGRPPSRVSFAFVIETIASLIAYAITALVALAAVGHPALEPYWPWLLVAIAGLVAVSHPALMGRIANRGLLVLGRPRYDFDAKGWDVALFMALTLANWLVFGVAFTLFAAAFAPAGITDYPHLAGSFSLAALVGMASVVVPSGLGVREGVLVWTLDGVVPVEAAIVVAIGSRVWFAGTELVLASVAWTTGGPRT